MAELTIQKRRSGTISGAERITGVKNAQAEMILSRRIQQYQNNYKKTKLSISLEEYKLENEARLLRLDSKTNDLDYKKRLYPNSDLSHEEMTVNSLQKYLIRNVGSQCYLDKRMGYAVRNRTAPEHVPEIVQKARLVLRNNAIMQELEESRRRMYSFMDQQPQSNRQPSHGNAFLTDIGDDDEMDMLEMKENQVMFPKLPAMMEENSIKQQQQRPKTIQDKLKANPVVRVAFENHRKQRELEEEERMAASPTLIISRMTRRKPPTKTDMMEEVAKVQENVEEFNKRIEQEIWDYKEEEFQQGLKFVKDKDTEWEKFVNKMNKRERAVTAAEGERKAMSKTEKRPITSYVPRQQLSDGQRKRLLLKNLLNNVELKAEASKTLPHKKGLPYHTAARMSRHSTSAKLSKMVDSNKAATAEAVIGPEANKQPPEALAVL
ncbi:uncharacterized protein [Watersipora subatra]|uniref:uncharacterized protein n=1 Tax=Watersipora subatra TaxID=2589382 RepID=UPI00355C8DD2